MAFRDYDVRDHRLEIARRKSFAGISTLGGPEYLCPGFYLLLEGNGSGAGPPADR